MPRRGAFLLIAALLIIALAIVALRHPMGREERPLTRRATDKQDFSRMEQGRYLAIVGDCAPCHATPDAKQPYAGGRRIETPFGPMLGANITPDVETGIGAWSDDAFDAALRRGVGHDGGRLYPAMPYPYFAKMSRDDSMALRAFLDTQPAVRNRVKSNQLSFPFSLRPLLAVWDALYFHDQRLHADATKSPAWNRGAYLVEGPAHCGACHTPKTALGGDEAKKTFRGFVTQGWFAPNISSDETLGVGDWTADDIRAYLKTGHNQYAAASGPMAEVVEHSTSRMTDADLEAVATYLKDNGSSPASSAKANVLPQNDPALVAGGAIYGDLCSACHVSDGRGVPSLFPSLSKSAAVRSENPHTLIRVVLQGARSVATKDEPTAPGMPAFGWQLDDAEVAAVLTYIRRLAGAPQPRVEASEVAKVRGSFSRGAE